MYPVSPLLFFKNFRQQFQRTTRMTSNAGDIQGLEVFMCFRVFSHYVFSIFSKRIIQYPTQCLILFLKINQIGTFIVCPMLHACYYKNAFTRLIMTKLIICLSWIIFQLSQVIMVLLCPMINIKINIKNTNNPTHWKKKRTVRERVGSLSRFF